MACKRVFSMAVAAAALMIALFHAIPASAFHPLITDDTGTQGKTNIELEFAYQYEEGPVPVVRPHACERCQRDLGFRI